MELTEKQEKFARAYIELGCASSAYRRSYDAEGMKPNVVHVKACELLSNGKVRVRVDELREKHQKRHEITVDKLTDMTMRAYDLAMTEKVSTPSAAVSAVTVLGKLHGLIVEKTKNEHTGADGQPLVPVINVTVPRD